MGIDRNNSILNMMYRGTTTIEDFNWDAMTTVPILYLMTPQDINYINNLILSPRYSGNNKYKMEKIDEVMHNRGFSRFAGGTNRLVYTHPMAPNAVFKVAIDSVGINDNPAEFRNQQFLKPYCCKVFECTPCGTIASFEKVDRITTFEEFYTIADDYYYIIVNVILGKYVMDDIGIDYFMNIGIRVGCYPVILDFPYLFELDGRKLECSSVLDDGRVCGGEIDYDAGFNKLVCKKCGRVYRARDLAKPPKEGGILLRQKGGRRMKLEITRGGKVIKTYDTTIERDYLSRNDRDVTNNRAAEVVLKRVEVETKKIKTPPARVSNNHEVTRNVVVKNEQHPVTIKRVIKEIDISKPETKSVNTDVSPVANRVEVVTSRPASKKDKTTDTNKVTVGPKVEVTHLEKPIVGRVIDVSIDKPKVTTDVVKADTESTPSIEITKSRETVVVKKEEKKHIDRIKGDPIVKVEDDTPKKVKTIEIDISGNKEEEKAPDIVEDIDKTSMYPVEPICVDLTPSSGKMQQAIFFGDEPGGYDPDEDKKEEAELVAKEEETTEDPEVLKLPIGTVLAFVNMIRVIDGDPEYDVNLIMDYYNNYDLTPRVGELVTFQHVDHNSNGDDTSIDISFRSFVCTDPENNVWNEINYDDSLIEKEILEMADNIYTVYDIGKLHDECVDTEIADEDDQLPEIAPDVDDEEEDDFEEENESECQIMVVTESISDEEAEDGVFYCIARHNKVDTSDIANIEDPRDINDNKYRIYLKIDGELVQVMYDYDEESWVVTHDTTMDVESLDRTYGIFVVDELPDVEDAIDNAYYLLKTRSEGRYQTFTKLPGSEDYTFCFCVIGDASLVETKKVVEHKDEPRKMSESDIEDMIVQLKASSKKKSLDEFLK